MTALAVAVAVVVGAICSELLIRNARKSAWPARRLSVMLRELRSFHAATDDDARQTHLIRGGLQTLTLSLALLVTIALVAAMFAAPILILSWDRTQSALYLAVTTISAIAWWLLRRAWRVR